MALKIKRQSDSWHLDNIELSAKEDPELHLPSRTVREDIPIGYFAKLIFRSEDPGRHERLWVEIVHKVGPCYEGCLRNPPVYSPLKDYLMLGQRVNFFAHNVLGISPPGKTYA